MAAARATRRPHARRAYSRSVSPTFRDGGSGGGLLGCGCSTWLLLLFLVLTAAVAVVVTR